MARSVCRGNAYRILGAFRLGSRSLAAIMAATATAEDGDGDTDAAGVCGSGGQRGGTAGRCRDMHDFFRFTVRARALGPACAYAQWQRMRISKGISEVRRCRGLACAGCEQACV